MRNRHLARTTPTTDRSLAADLDRQRAVIEVMRLALEETKETGR